MRSGNTPAAATITDADERPIPDDDAFALLLTHDVDRPYKTYQSVYYALTDAERRWHHLESGLPGTNPYWQFEAVAALEADLGVRSAFYALDEQSLFDRPLREWLSKDSWQLYAGRYDIEDTDVVRVLRALDRGGWEVGLHGSFHSFDDRERLAAEKRAVERAVGRPVRGGRQHYLNLDPPGSWRHHRAVGLRYDTSLGSSSEYGFRHGYGLYRPFDDDFVVFPLTLMEQALPDPTTEFEAAWTACEELLVEAREHNAVATVLWHPRYFSDADFPNYARLYRRLIERALDMDAWVGSPGQFYDAADLGDADGVLGDAE